MDARVIRRTIDLTSEYREQDVGWRQRMMLTGSVKADRLCITVLRASEAAELTGVTAKAYFLADGLSREAVPCEVDANVISVDFVDEIYAKAGPVVAMIYLADGQRNVPLYREEFYIEH